MTTLPSSSAVEDISPILKTPCLKQTSLISQLAVSVFINDRKSTTSGTISTSLTIQQKTKHLLLPSSAVPLSVSPTPNSTKFHYKKEQTFGTKHRTIKSRSHNLRTAIATLERHKQFARRMPVNQLIVTIVNETGMIGTLKTGKQGQQRWSNYQKLLELARNFDGDENKQILPDFIEFLDILITEEPQEGQAPVEASSGAVRIMTIHAAKGLQFPIVILPRLDRGPQTDREPFIDEAFGIGFSPLNPDKDYSKTEPDIVTHMKNRTNEKETAEKKRLFYVGTTRAKDRLILSGTLSASGKPQQMLEWLYKHLNIGEEDRFAEPTRYIGSVHRKQQKH